MNPSELLELIPERPKNKECRCHYQRYRAWSVFSEKSFSTLENLGELENKLPPNEVRSLPFPEFNYWQEKYPISLEHFPQAYGEALKCTLCGAMFIYYLETSGHIPEKRIRWIQPNLFPEDYE